jgi:hypothetical protein
MPSGAIRYKSSPKERTMRHEKILIEQFKHDVSRHRITVFQDVGVYRHLRFQRPGTYIYGFDLITWPGHLCFTGDMRTYVFGRVQDMFTFFRKDPEAEDFRIDMRYWAEKCLAVDKMDGIWKFSPDRFKEYAQEHTNDWLRGLGLPCLSEPCEDDHPGDLDPIDRSALQAQLQDALDAAGNGDEQEATRKLLAIRAGKHGHVFPDQCELPSFKAPAFRFQWCCYALEWAIGAYDEYKAGPANKEGQ